MRHPGREGYDRWQVVSAGQKPLEDSLLVALLAGGLLGSATLDCYRG